MGFLNNFCFFIFVNCLHTWFIIILKLYLFLLSLPCKKCIYVKIAWSRITDLKTMNVVREHKDIEKPVRKRRSVTMKKSESASSLSNSSSPPKRSRKSTGDRPSSKMDDNIASDTNTRNAYFKINFQSGCLKKLEIKLNNCIRKKCVTLVPIRFS